MPQSRTNQPKSRIVLCFRVSGQTDDSASRRDDIGRILTVRMSFDARGLLADVPMVEGRPRVRERWGHTFETWKTSSADVQAGRAKKQGVEKQKVQCPMPSLYKGLASLFGGVWTRGSMSGAHLKWPRSHLRRSSAPPRSSLSLLVFVCGYLW